jgi:hypothetical protein
VALPDCRENVADRVCDCELVVVVVLVIVMLPVLVSAVLFVAEIISLARVVEVHPLAVEVSVAAPTPRVALPLADQ